MSIIGGANIDIIGTPYYNLNPNDSTPGKSTLALGGVARNIADNLSRLGVNIEFITVLGNDSYSSKIQDSCNELNISLKHSLIMPDERTSTYLCINNELGEMQLAISDMEIYKYITPSYLKDKIELINAGSACVLDTNIPQESLEYIMDNARIPIFLDTVSTKKTEKIKDSIRNIHTLKPNIIEAEILSNMKIHTTEDLEKATDLILKKGIERLFVSLGEKGVYYTDGIRRGRILPIPVEVINTTGAGDSYIAALVWAHLNDYNIEKSAKAGLAASSICIQSHMTVSEHMSAETIKNLIK